MFEPAEGVVPPERDDASDSVISEQGGQQKEETQPSPELDKALSVKEIRAETSESDSFGELPKAGNTVEVESPPIEQTSGEIRETETAQELSQEQAKPPEQKDAVVLTPEHIETPKGPSALTSTAVEAMSKREAARLSLAKRSNLGLEKEAA